MAEDSDSEVAGMTFSRAPPAVPAAAADDGLVGAESKKEAKIAATQRVKEEAARAAAAHQELLDSFGSGEELNLVHTVIFRRPKHLVGLEYLQMPDEKERQDTIKRDTANTVGFWRGDKHHHGGRELNGMAVSQHCEGTQSVHKGPYRCTHPDSFPQNYCRKVVSK